MNEERRKCMICPFSAVQEMTDKLFNNPGQGSPMDQLAKMVRESQRIRLWEILKQIPEEEVTKMKVTVAKHIPQVSKKEPALMRFSIPSWAGHNEVFWQALGDYLILYLWSVTDVDYGVSKGKLCVRYFDTKVRREKPPEFIATVIARIAYAIDQDIITTDFTRFRRMTERRHTIGGMSVEEAALFMTFIKGLGI